jgi:hypothetical protein
MDRIGDGKRRILWGVREGKKINTVGNKIAKEDFKAMAVMIRNSDMLPTAIKHLKSFVKQIEEEQWISVEDAMPPDGKQVLVLTENGFTNRSNYSGGQWVRWKIHENGGRITYWYPIPDCPKQ